MKRVTVLIMLTIVMLVGCTVDPCTFDKSSPSCEVKQSEARATIGAIDADREMRSTQSAIFLEAEATKAAINAEATRQVTGAEATHEAMRIEATKQALRTEATQSAVVYESTRTSVNGEATKIALSVGSAIERSQAERAATPYNAVFNVLVFWFLVPVLLVIAVIIYGQRTVKRVSEAAAAAVAKRAARVDYGPPNDPKVGWLIFDPKSGQPVRFITAEGTIGSFSNLLTGGTVLDQLNVPDDMKLEALVEAKKRSDARGIAAATGKTPWEGAALTQSFYDEQAGSHMELPQPVRYQINVVSSTLEPMPAWLDEIDRRLLEARHD
jgi:hypothetical protein